MTDRHPFTFGPASGRRKSAVIAVSIGDQDFVPVEQADRLRGLLDELIAAVEAHCDVDHGTRGCPHALVDRVRREAREVR